mgnify:CR=1 FL=1
MCRCAAALTAQQRSGFSDDRQARRSAKFVWKRSLTAINALQKRFRRAKAMVVQSYKGNRLSILYLNRFGRLAHLRRAHRSGCRSKAAFVPLRSRPKSHGRPKTKRSRRTSGRVSGSEQVCVSHRFQKNDVPIDSVPSTVQAFQKFTAFQKAQVCKEMQAFLTISRVHPSPKRHRSEDGIDK